jgi:hypothetical protein
MEDWKWKVGNVKCKLEIGIWKVETLNCQLGHVTWDMQHATCKMKTSVDCSVPVGKTGSENTRQCKERCSRILNFPRAPFLVEVMVFSCIVVVTYELELGAIVHGV